MRRRICQCCLHWHRRAFKRTAAVQEALSGEEAPGGGRVRAAAGPSNQVPRDLNDDEVFEAPELRVLMNDEDDEDSAFFLAFDHVMHRRVRPGFSWPIHCHIAIRRKETVYLTII
ncbi:hypothetical protein VaNZ11_007025 [Volvox africanus]|uniref:Uncharacterized protein n=1 Tax=Volvox africanus TaxID=51714 RepID=A0ABQ5S222_9CHLO|nr:hypothetical protein VaNZ11_007025 [Volvox africanus]